MSFSSAPILSLSPSGAVGVAFDFRTVGHCRGLLELKQPELNDIAL
jgi:hypothetical protein